MTPRRLAIVTTTIYVPRVLEHHVRMAESFDGDVLIVVAGDLKTESGAAELCVQLDSTGAARVVYLDPDDQRRFLADYPELETELPWNSVQRRNVAILFAYLEGADAILTIDDDNVPLDDDFLRAHDIVGARRSLPQLGAPEAWLNVCELLTERDGTPFFHRGYPLDRRWNVPPATLGPAVDANVVVNAGLWLGDPDVDALTRIYKPVEATQLSVPMPTSAVLAPNGWGPFDSQNTTLAREVIPAYFLSPHVGRYDDIWASYILLRAIHARGDAVAFGLPLVRQDRNPHDYWIDFDLERMGYEVTPAFVDALRTCPLEGASYHDHAAELAAWLDAAATDLSPKPHYVEQLRRYAAGLDVWARLF